MAKKTLYILGILATIVLATIAQVKFKCDDCQERQEEEELEYDKSVSNDAKNGFSFSKDGVGFICNDNFKFPLNGFKVKESVGDSINMGIKELKSYLDQHPNEKVKITGICASTEENTSAFPNLGYARANQIKNYFVTQGIDVSRLTTYGSKKEAWDTHDNVVWGPVNLDIIENNAENTVDWNSFKSKLNEYPLNLEFGSGEAEIKLSDDQRMMISKITQYLDNVENSKIAIIGHTDNLGSRESNIALGLERAAFAKTYLVKNGVDINRIDVSSEGPDKPIADNSLDSGREKNRRIIVLLK